MSDSRFLAESTIKLQLGIRAREATLTVIDLISEGLKHNEFFISLMGNCAVAEF